jgi:hypothetical protein
MRSRRDQKGAPTSETPIFDALVAECQRASSADLISMEELDRRRPLTSEDRALAEEFLSVLDRLEAEQGSEVTDVQSQLLNVILIASHYLRGEPARSLAEWSAYTGLPQAELRAVALALEEVGLDTQQTSATG